MPYKILNKRGDWLVQVQRAGIRKTKRGTGGEQEAKRAEALLIAELDQEIRLAEAARLLGLDPATMVATAAKPMMTLREYFDTRWVEHAKVVQNQTTRRAQRTAFNYLLFYLGDKPLDALLRRSEINAFVEALKSNGPITFAVRKDGKPVARKCEELRQLAPLLPEVVEFASETGLRRAELFHLAWRSVELQRAAIRIETQAKSRVVNVKTWKPKNNKWREVPLSRKARSILERRLAGGPLPLDEPVFPNRGGCPYERMDGAGEGAGSGWFPAAVEAAGLKGKVTFHGLRHLFAVRLLTRGVPIRSEERRVGKECR